MPVAASRRPIEGPAVWRGTDFAGGDAYVVRLTPPEIAEIDCALDALGDRTAAWETLRRADFPFDALARTLQTASHEIDDGRGFVVLRGIPVDRYTPDQRKALYWGIGAHVGVEHVRQDREGTLMGPITDVGLNYEANVRGYKTTAELTPHNDPTDFVALFCIGKAKEGGLSAIASSLAVYNEILRSHPEYLEPLYRGFHRDLRGEGRDVAREASPRNPVYSESNGTVSCWFNGRTILHGPKKTGIALSELEVEAVKFVMSCAADPAFRLDMPLEPGDIQILNNHVTFHARTPFVDDEAAGRKRFLYRLWGNTFRRPLAAGFSERRKGYDHPDGPIRVA